MVNNRLVLVLFGLLMSRNAAFGQTIRVQPFLQQATPDSIWIVWETTSGEEARVLYGTTEQLGSTAFGETFASQGPHRIHQTRLMNLEADTLYFYRVRTGSALSDVFRFRTPPEASDEKPTRFIAISDTQADGGNPDKLEEIVNDGILAYSAANFGPDPADAIDFVVLAGDLVDAGSVYDQWKNDLFDESRNLLAFTPLYPALGNHEQDAHWYFDYFRLPENGTQGYLEHWYFIDHSNVRIISLDSNDAYRLPQQLAWLDGVLAEAASDDAIDFVFAQLHHPYLSEFWTPGNTDYTGEVVRRLEAFSDATGKPSVHFFGHTHAYSRGQSRDHRHVWMNVATGEGNIDYWGEYPMADYPEFQRSFPDWGFVVTEVEAGDDPALTFTRVSRGNEIEARNNEVNDSFTIRRFARAPHTPEPVEPGDGARGLDPDSVSLRASAFSDPDSTLHLESHFQLWTDAGGPEDPDVDRWVRFENWHAPAGASGPGNGYFSVNTVADGDITRALIGGLSPETTYRWRVRYRDDSLMWSGWSSERSFTTGRRLSSGNLIINPGAELGVYGWTVIDPPIESIASGECDAGGARAGERFFAVGGVCADEGPYGEVFQRRDVREFAPSIDDSIARAIVSAWMRNHAGSDRPRAWIACLDESLSVLGEGERLEGVSPEWTEHRASMPIPPATRWIEMHLSGTRAAGTDNDSYFDDLSLEIIVEACPGDMDGDSDADAADFFAFLDAFARDDPGSDINGDGTIDASDFFAYLDRFILDCA